MSEKELRLALVCFGGVSLAVYMHGICTEVLKLVRASAALHGITDRASRAAASFTGHGAQRNGNLDTEPAYFDLLKVIGRKVELRVIVDVIAGASAGGINGAMLARALAHDLPIEDLTELWLANGDVEILLASEARAGRWSKLVLRPLIWGAASAGFLNSTRDPEVRKNLSLFVRSRWFQPPFDGPRMTGLMLDALDSLARSARVGASLIPSGQRLDLFVTLTDYHGRPDLLQLHDPVFVQEEEHRHVVHMRYRRNQNGDAENDFHPSNSPALAFVARATSSFPGAFPPARIVELDELLAQRGIAWPDRQSFVERCFSSYVESKIDPATVCFIDGGVLNNRPFKEAIAAIQGRPAYRQVDRRVVYLEPTPNSLPLPSERTLPGFLPTLKAAISDLPRAQPVTDELNALHGYNERVRGLRNIIDGARPRITRLIAQVIPEAPLGQLPAEQITRWRQHANARVRLDAGFAYESYVQLKLRSAVSFLGRLVTDLRGVSRRSPFGMAIARVIDAWAAESGILGSDTVANVLPDAEPALENSPRWVQFLLAFDTDYRRRRLHFLVEGQNRLYQLIEHGDFPGLDASVVDRLKREFYEQLDRLDGIQSSRRFSAESRAEVEALFPQPTMSDTRDLGAFAARFVGMHQHRLDCLIARLATECDLQASSRDLDVLLSTMDPAQWQPKARYEVLVNYLGFPYWDVLTLPVTATREPGEFHEILIDRISPADALTLRELAGADKLKSGALGGFAGFFSRAYRENDYLLGRLHAVDRLIDIVCDAAGINPLANEIDIIGLKKRAFSAIFRAENSRLVSTSELKGALRRSIMTL